MTRPENSAVLLQVKRSSLRTAFIIAISGLLITTTVSLYIYFLNQSYLKTRFLESAQDRVTRVTEKLQLDISQLNDIKRFFEASEAINQKEFTHYSKSLITRNHFWIVGYAELTPKESLGNIIPKKIENNKPVPLKTDKSTYYLLKNIEPFSKFSNFIDWDISSADFIQTAIDSSLADNSIYISDAPRFNLKDSSTNFRFVLTPVYRLVSGINSLDGVLMAVYPIDSIIRGQSVLAKPRGLSLTLFEGDSQEKLRKIFYLAPIVGSEEIVEDPDLVYSSSFEIEGKKFQVEVKPNSYFIERNYSNSYILIFILGCVSTVIVSLIAFRYLSGRRFKRIVAEFAEEAKKKNFAIIREYLNSSVDMIAMKTAGGEFYRYNKIFAELASGQKFEKLPEPTELNILPEMKIHFDTLDDKIFPESDLVLYQFVHDGFVYDVRKFPVMMDDDELFIGLIVRDITTEINQLNEILEYSKKLEDNNKTKNRFFSIIAHDLRSPFQGILGFLEVILDDYDEIDDAEKKKLLSQIFASTKNIYDLLDNLLEWSRTQTDRIPSQPEQIKLSEVMEIILGLYESVAIKKNIFIENKISEDICVFADRNMVRTIFRNLLSNAIKFTRAGGKVTLDVKVVPNGHNSTESHLVFSVADTGVGIDKGTLEKIFKLDEKTVTRGTENEKGTGLGLILVKEFVERNGGTIWIESAPGAGSTFYFTLPVCEDLELCPKSSS